jgi:putative redox protein
MEPMKVTLNRMNDKVHFRAISPDGHSIDIDGAPRVGGENAGFRPMQLVLAAHAGCTAMDLVPILQKQRQQLDDVTIEIRGERAEGTPSPFTTITIHYNLYGEIEEAKARRAVELAVNKYCSVGEMLKHSVDVSFTFSINPGRTGDEASA